jgi:DNA-binding response OmpR family regulator
VTAALEVEKAVVAVLVVSRAAADHDTLKNALRGSKWSLHHSSDVMSALRLLRQHDGISLVVCDRELWRDLWKDMLATTAAASRAPLLIVAARDADEQLWAEALNLGAYDVLVKPFDTAEVVRSLSLGWLRWHHHRVPSPAKSLLSELRPKF